MNIWLMLLGVLVLAFCFAKLEIQIEGPNGWASSLPTWKLENHRLLRIFFGGRILTGYHFWALILMFLVFHLPYTLGIIPSVKSEACIISEYLMFWILEDLFWFVLNPYWGIRKFKKQYVPWHKNWIFGLPVEYWIFTAVSAGLLSLSHKL